MRIQVIYIDQYIYYYQPASNQPAPNKKTTVYNVIQHYTMLYNSVVTDKRVATGH